MLQRPLLQLGIFFSTCAVAGGLALDRGVAAREVDSRQLTFDVHPARCAREREHDNVDAARRAIARGQKIFNTAPIVITGVAGLNNQTFPSGVTVPDPFTSTCTTCHDTPNAGDHSVKALLNIGLTDVSRRTADMPLYTLRRLSTGETTQTTEPQREHAIQVLLDFGRRIAARGVQCNREARAERELALVAILSAGSVSSSDSAYIRHRIASSLADTRVATAAARSRNGTARAGWPPRSRWTAIDALTSSRRLAKSNSIPCAIRRWIRRPRAGPIPLYATSRMRS